MTQNQKLLFQSQSLSFGTNSVINYNDPNFLFSNDNLNAQIVHIVFSGSNCVNWSHSVVLAISAKNKLGFVDGSLLRPPNDSVNL